MKFSTSTFLPLLGAVACVLAVPPHLSAGELGRQSLPDGWGQISDPAHLGLFIGEGSRLSLRLGDGKHPANFDSRSMEATSPCALTEVDNDFVVDVTVDPVPPGDGETLRDKGPAQCGAGLTVLLDRKTYVRFGDVAFTTGNKEEIHELVFDYWENGIQKSLPNPDNGALVWDPVKPLRLQLERKGNRLVAAVSQDQTHWERLYPIDLWRWPAKVSVGIYGHNTGSALRTVQLSNFHLSTSSAALPFPEKFLVARPPESLAKLDPANALPGDWGIRLDPESLADFKVDDHGLSVSMAGVGADYTYSNHVFNAPLALTEVEGDFAFQVILQPLPQPEGVAMLASSPNSTTSPSVAAGLIAMANDEKFARFNSRIDVYQGGSQNHELRCELEPSRPVGIPGAHGPWEPGKPVYLRYERRGVVLRASHSADGVEWFYLAPLDISEWPAKIRVGIDVCQTGSSPFVAQFSNRVLTMGRLAPVPLAQLPAAADNIPGWGNKIDPTQTSTFTPTADGLTMALSAQYTDLQRDNSSAPRALVEARGDFTVQVRVDAPSSLGQKEKRRSAGLLLQVNDRNFFRLDRGVFVDQKNRSSPQLICKFVIQGFEQYKFDDQNHAWNPDAPLWLRLQRRGGWITASVSEDGAKWTELTSQLLDEWPERLHTGVFAVNNSGSPATFQFHDFKLLEAEQP